MPPLRWALPLAAIVLTGTKLAIYAALAGGSLDTAMCQWDCGWYLSIVQQGYDASQYMQGGFSRANWPFFPLYPMLLSGVAALTDADPRLIGVVVSSLCFVAFAVLGARYRAVTRNESSPWTWLLLICAWPFSLYFHAPYTEALYAALVTAALLALAVGRPLTAGIATALLTATRPTGILLAAWIGFDRLWQMRRAATPLQALRMLLPAVIAPLGLLAFMVFLYFRTGDALAFHHIQSSWQRSGDNPIVVLTKALMRFDPFHPHAGALYLPGWALLGLAAAGWLLFKRRFAEAWLCGMTVVMALSSGTVFSISRYVSASPVFLFAVADILNMVRSLRWRAAILVAMAALQLFLVVAWYRGAEFLM